MVKPALGFNTFGFKLDPPVLATSANGQKHQGLIKGLLTGIPAEDTAKHINALIFDGMGSLPIVDLTEPVHGHEGAVVGDSAHLMAVAVVEHAVDGNVGVLGPLFLILPLGHFAVRPDESIHIDLGKLVHHFSVGVDASMEVVAVFKQKTGKVLPPRQMRFRDVVGVPHVHLVHDGVVNHDFTDAVSFFSDGIVNLASKEEVYLVVEKDPLEAVSTTQFGGIAYVVGDHHFPFAGVADAVGGQLGDSLERFIGDAPVEVESFVTSFLRYVDQKCAFPGLGHP